MNTLSLCFSVVFQAWWVGEEFFADIWRVCVNNTNCTELNDAVQGECEADGRALSEKRPLGRRASLWSDPSPLLPSQPVQRGLAAAQGRGSRVSIS